MATKYGDAIRNELKEAEKALGPVIAKVEDYLMGFEKVVQDDPILMRELLWRCLLSMRQAKENVERAEWHRYMASPRRKAAIKREQEKKEQDGK